MRGDEIKDGCEGPGAPGRRPRVEDPEPRFGQMGGQLPLGAASPRPAPLGLENLGRHPRRPFQRSEALTKLGQPAPCVIRGARAKGKTQSIVKRRLIGIGLLDEPQQLLGNLGDGLDLVALPGQQLGRLHTVPAIKAQRRLDGAQEIRPLLRRADSPLFEFALDIPARLRREREAVFASAFGNDIKGLPVFKRHSCASRRRSREEGSPRPRDIWCCGYT